MTEEIEPNDQDRAVIKAPKLSCDAAEAQKITEELGLGVLSLKESTEEKKELRSPDFTDLLKLGIFVEGSGVVQLDHGRIAIAGQVMVRQMIRLEQEAQAVKIFADKIEISRAIALLGTCIGKISTIGIKTKVAAEEAAEELRKKKQPSWEAGAGVGGVPVTAVQAQAGSTVHLHAAPNGVAGTLPVA